MVQRDLAAVVRGHAHADFTFENKDNPEAFGAVAAHELPLAEASDDSTLGHYRLFFGRKFRPERESGNNQTNRSSLHKKNASFVIYKKGAQGVNVLAHHLY